MKSKRARPAPGSSAQLNMAIAPGLIMCLLTLVMLAAELLISESDRQYDLYPILFRWADLLIVISVLVYYCKILMDKRRRHALRDAICCNASALCWLLLLACIIISTCINGLTSFAVQGVPYRYISVFNTISFILIYMGASSLVGSKGLRLALLQIFAIVADLIALAALYSQYISEIPAFQDKKELSAVFFNGNHYGYFLAMAVLTGAGLLLYTDGTSMLIGTATYTVNLVLLGINHSLGSILAVVITLAAAVLLIAVRDRSRAKRIVIMLAVTAALSVAALMLIRGLRQEFTTLGSDIAAILSGHVQGSEGHNRIMIWQTTCGYIAKRPIFGYGCEGIALQLYQDIGRSNAHCEILTYAAYYGIPAAIMYTLAVILTLRRCIRISDGGSEAARIAGMAATGYFIASLTGVAMFYTTPYFFIMLGLAGSPIEDSR